MVYWKFRFQFGKTTEEGIRKLQHLDYRVKSISFIHYLILSFIKYIFMIVLMIPTIMGMLIMTICRMLMMIINKPVELYVKYFLK